MNKYKWIEENLTILNNDTKMVIAISNGTPEAQEYLKYIADGGQVDPMNIPDPLAQNVFTKLQIRRAMRVLGNESILDGLLTNETFATDWYDAVEIDLNDPMTKQALLSVSVDIDAIKRQILGI